MKDPQPLPDDPAELKKLVAELQAQLRKSLADQAHTQELLQELLRAKRGRLSEKLSGDQLALFAAAWPVHGPDEKPAEPQSDSGGNDEEPRPPGVAPGFSSGPCTGQAAANNAN